MILEDFSNLKYSTISFCIYLSSINAFYHRYQSITAQARATQSFSILWFQYCRSTVQPLMSVTYMTKQNTDTTTTITTTQQPICQQDCGFQLYRTGSSWEMKQKEIYLPACLKQETVCPKVKNIFFPSIMIESLNIFQYLLLKVPHGSQ